MNKATIFDTDAPHPEASNLTAFSQNALDRQAEKRDDDCVSTALAIEGTHILAFTTGKLVLKHDDQVLDPLFAAYELAELKPDFDNAILLGYKQNGEPRIAVPVQTTEEELASHFKPVDARALYRDQLLDEDLLGETAQAVSLFLRPLRVAHGFENWRIQAGLQQLRPHDFPAHRSGGYHANNRFGARSLPAWPWPAFCAGHVFLPGRFRGTR
jgi:hypothetical protein